MSNLDPSESEFVDALDHELRRLAIDLDERQWATFRSYRRLLDEWNDRAGLTAIREPAEVARRLVGESLALLVALRSAGILEVGQPARIADIGPGGGVPSLSMRIVDPALRFVLIESQQRRCTFLEAAATELGLDGVEVLNARAEDAGRDEAQRASFDVVVARAVAPLAVLVEYALPLLRTGGVLATPKGSRAAEELADAEAAIAALGGSTLESVALPLPDGVPPQQVVLVRRVGELDDRFPRRAGVPSKRPLA